MSEVELIARRAASIALREFQESHPRPTHVTQKQAAEMLSVSARTIYNMVRAGTLKLNQCGMIPIEMIDAVRSV